jgi:DNA processing protein
LDETAPDYPSKLRALTRPPERLVVQGGSLEASRVVAVVGTRKAYDGAVHFAEQLAGALARAGVVVASGGATGIDAAAHRGALAAGGRTWAVTATGRNHCFPAEHADLYRQIAEGPGAMVWPFDDDVAALPGNFHRRNGVLVGLADAVVIVQAGAPSGTLNTAAWAKRYERPVWAVPGPPWDEGFTGCRAAIDAGARVVTSMAGLLRDLDVEATETLQLALTLEPPPRSRPSKPVAPPAIVPPTDAAGLALWEACDGKPRHIDEIADAARVCARTAATRLLTLALENVLVEGPDGFYRRQIQP